VQIRKVIIKKERNEEKKNKKKKHGGELNMGMGREKKRKILRVPSVYPNSITKSNFLKKNNGSKREKVMGGRILAKNLTGF